VCSTEDVMTNSHVSLVGNTSFYNVPLVANIIRPYNIPSPAYPAFNRSPGSMSSVIARGAGGVGVLGAALGMVQIIGVG
jgi:hypothetical protein